MKFSVALLLIATASLIDAKAGGFENFLCGADPNAKVYLPCAVDCQHNHGALTGECPGVRRGDFNCKCKGQAEKVYEKSLQCTIVGDNLRQVCNVDCICQHGAKGGYCDWNRKACVCRGINNNNVHCPFNTIPEYAKFMSDTAGYELGEYGNNFLKPWLTNGTGKPGLSYRARV